MLPNEVLGLLSLMYMTLSDIASGQMECECLQFETISRICNPGFVVLQPFPSVVIWISS